MHLVTAEEMRLLDQKAISEYGIPGIVLMENAGLAVVKVIKDHFAGSLARKRILVFAGKGNNGGDGFVVARHLANAGCDVKIYLLCRPEELQGDALTNWKIARKMNIRYQLIVSDKDLNVVKVGLMYTELVVDGIFGTGFKGGVQGTVAKLIDLINESDKTVISIDLPSGMEADTGFVKGSCIRANYTVTFALPKLGLVLEQAEGYVGDLVTGDISLPGELIKKQQFNRYFLDYSFCKSFFPSRATDSHKGSFGHVVVIGGSPGMTGAATLAAWAAVRSGAGLVTAAVPTSLNQVLESKLTEAMCFPLPETGEGTLSLSALEPIRKFVSGKVAVFGPGLSRHKESQDIARAFVQELPCPVVLDADALFALADGKEHLKNSKFPVVLTPHPGEMARLLDKSIGEIQKDRISAVTEGANKYNCIVVLKGAKTLVATPEGRLYVNSTGNPGMATGGSGDVLAGIIGALMAQNIKPEHAAAIAVYVHGRAGDLAAAEKSQMGLAAGDIIEYLAPVFLEFEGCR